jgi:hypothetical protein
MRADASLDEITFSKLCTASEYIGGLREAAIWLFSEAAVEIENLDGPDNIVARRCRKAMDELREEQP